MESNSPKQLINIPNKRYFTIGEVSEICGIKTHVLRYWEQEFNQLAPIKRTGNRRYYQQKDLILVSQINDLLQNQGYTIEGAKHKLEEKDNKEDHLYSKKLINQIRMDLEKILSELKK